MHFDRVAVRSTVFLDFLDRDFTARLGQLQYLARESAGKDGGARMKSTQYVAVAVEIED
jgi:hypothetical protein